MNQTQILFIPIMGCNLACPYCHFTWHGKGTWSAYGNQRRQHLDMLDAWEWLEAFDPFAPYHLEITGGEPTIYPGLATLLGMLPDGCTWSITSNCLASVPYLPSAARCTSWTSSWHGRQFERFCGELERLEGMGHRPSVSVVARPGHLDQVGHALASFSHRYRVNILRQFAPGVDWLGTHAEQWARLQALAADYMANLVEDEIPPSWQFARHAACDAGSRAYFCAMPDGRVYRCYSDAFMRPDSALGYLGAGWRPLEPGQPCGQDCAGCAADHRARKQERDAPCA